MISRVLAVMLLACALGPPSPSDSARSPTHTAPDVDSLLAVFPMQFDVAPGNRLYLFGRPVTNARLTTAEGDTLYLNDLPILPQRIDTASVRLSEEQYRNLYEDVPFVQRHVEEGASYTAASQRYLEETKALRRRLCVAYEAATREGCDREAAGAAALRRLRELDTYDLVDPERSYAEGWNYVALHWRGKPFNPSELELGPPELWDAPHRMPSDGKKVSRARELQRLLTDDSWPCWHFFVYGGDATFCGAESVAKVASQIERFRQGGDPKPGPLSEGVLQHILDREER